MIVKGLIMVVGIIMALMIGAGMQAEYNVLDKPVVVKTEVIEIEKEVVKEITKEVVREVIVEVEVKVKPKSITCTPVVKY